jgi:hypothetical protein
MLVQHIQSSKILQLLVKISQREELRDEGSAKEKHQK